MNIILDDIDELCAVEESDVVVIESALGGTGYAKGSTRYYSFLSFA